MEKPFPNENSHISVEWSLAFSIVWNCLFGGSKKFVSWKTEETSFTLQKKGNSGWTMMLINYQIFTQRSILIMRILNFSWVKYVNQKPSNYCEHLVWISFIAVNLPVIHKFVGNLFGFPNINWRKWLPSISRRITLLLISHRAIQPHSA